MATLFLDTEFNGPGGDLISMALVGYDREFYEVLGCKDPAPWVKENVMPVLNKESICVEEFKDKLLAFFENIQSCYIVSDSYKDVAYFCSYFTKKRKSKKGPSSITFEANESLWTGKSKIRHNALEDARALKRKFDGLQR